MSLTCTTHFADEETGTQKGACFAQGHSVSDTANMGDCRAPVPCHPSVPPSSWQPEALSAVTLNTV
jgi:hypothetical protein